MMRPTIKVVLVEPEIPPNTGAIGRVCVGMGLPLYLVGKLGFSLNDSKLKRAGLDYWSKLDLHLEPDVDVFRGKLAQERPVLFSKKARQIIWDTDLRSATALVFGKETQGLSEEWFSLNVPIVKFPQTQDIRSYNLATVASAAIFEWARQVGWRE